MAGDLNAKHTFSTSIVFNPSGMKLLNLLHINKFEISAPQCPTHYSPMGNGDVFEIVVHKNVQLAEVTVSNILDSDHLPNVLHLLNPVRTRNLSDQVHKFMEWEQSQSLASNFISPRIQINSGEEANKVDRDFTASAALAHRLFTRKLILSYLNNDLPSLESLLSHKWRLRKLWQVTRDPACKTALNCLTGSPKPSENDL
jgi:hypothetical protein